MVSRHTATAEAVGEHRDTQGLRDGAQRIPRTGKVHVGAGDDRRLPRSGDELGRSTDFVRVGVRAARDERFWHIGIRVAEDDVERKIAEDRPAVRRQGLFGQRVDERGDRRGVGRGRGPLRDRCEHGDVVELLQRACTPPRLGRPSAEHHERRAVEVGGGDGRDAVGHARAGGEHGDSRSARQLGRGFGRERRRLLVTDVDDAPVVVRSLRHCVVEREDVAAREREHLPHAVAREGRERELTTMTVHTREPTRSRNVESADHHASGFSN